MKKLMTISLLFMFAAFWTGLCQAGNVVYFAPDGSEITQAQYDRLVSGKTDTYQRSKNAARSKPSNNNQMASRSESKAVPVKANRTQPKPPKAHQGGKIYEIRDSDIRKIAKNILQSANKMDSKGIIAYLAPSYKVTIKTYEGELSLTRDEYITYLEEGWNAFGFYRARLDSEKITITPDKQKATLEAGMTEIVTLTNGASIKVQTHQKSIFEVVDGKILITSAEAREQGL